MPNAEWAAPVSETRLVVAPPLVRAICDELHDAASVGDDERARVALGCVLVLAGGTSDGKMETAKTPRAYGFALDGSRVTYRIERHPGRSWLTHRTETRAVDLETGAEMIISRRLPRLTLADLERFTLMPDSKWTRDARHRSAADALEYAIDVASRAILGIDDGDIAIGWVARGVRCTHPPQRWYGVAGDLQSAFAHVYGFGVYRAMRLDFVRRAQAICDEARSLWESLPRATSTWKVAA